MLALLLAAVVLVVPGRYVAAQPADWASGPEALFLTPEERDEWRRLTSDADREVFKDRYWARRDPTPGTGRNEFREVVLGRIKTADARFALGSQRGSTTARGTAFIVLGSPARARENAVAGQDAPPAIGSAPKNPVGWTEPGETVVEWLYDTERTPRILEAIGRPRLTVTFVIDPRRRTDRMQAPAEFNEAWAAIARRSIVEPSTVAERGVIPPPATRTTAERQPLGPAERAGFEEAIARPVAAGTFGHAVLLAPGGRPKLAVWFVQPADADSHLRVDALIRDGEGQEILADWEEVAASSEFSISASGSVFSRELEIPPGTGSGEFVLRSGTAVLAGGRASWDAPDPGSTKGLVVSSIVLTDGRLEGVGRSISAFALPPRADATFARGELLWYYFEVLEPPAGGLYVEAQIRRENKPVGITESLKVELQPLSADRSVGGLRVPTDAFPAGDYVLYVTIRAADDPSRRAVRRAAFRLTDAQSR